MTAPAAERAAAGAAWLDEHGFLPAGISDERPLTAAWRDLIAARRAAQT